MVRRSGLRSWIAMSLRVARCSPASPRARIRFEPPSEEPIRSGQPRAIAPAELLEPVARGHGRGRSPPRIRARSPGSQRGGHSWSRATSHSAAQSMSVYSRQRSRLTWTWVSLRLGAAGPLGPPRVERLVRRPVAAVEDVPAEDGDVHAAGFLPACLRSSASMAPNFLTGEELDRAALLALLDRAEELKRGRAEGVGGDALGRPLGRPCLRAALDAHPDLVRGRGLRAGRPPRRAARRRAAADARGVRRRHRPGDVPLPVTRS